MASPTSVRNASSSANRKCSSLAVFTVEIHLNGSLRARVQIITQGLRLSLPAATTENVHIASCAMLPLWYTLLSLWLSYVNGDF